MPGGVHGTGLGPAARRARRYPDRRAQRGVCGRARPGRGRLRRPRGPPARGRRRARPAPSRRRGAPARCARRPGSPPSRRRPCAQSRSAGGSVANRRRQERLPRRTDQPRALRGRARRGASRLRQQASSCARRASRTRCPGRARARLARHARRRRRAPMACAEFRGDVADDVVVVGVAVHVARAAAHVHQHERGPRRAATSPSAGSYCSPLMSLTSDAPGGQRGVGDVGLVGVDGDRDRAAARASASRTGRTRATLLAASTGCAPGPRRLAADVEDVGALRLHRERARRPRARRRSTSPPSENESGVTLRTPMTSVRGAEEERAAAVGSGMSIGGGASTACGLRPTADGVPLAQRTHEGPGDSSRPCRRTSRAGAARGPCVPIADADRRPLQCCCGSGSFSGGTMLGSPGRRSSVGAAARLGHRDGFSSSSDSPRHDLPHLVAVEHLAHQQFVGHLHAGSSRFDSSTRRARL